MKWLVYLFVVVVSLGLLKRGKSKWYGYVAWAVMSLLLGLGLLFL